MKEKTESILNKLSEDFTSRQSRAKGQGRKPSINPAIFVEARGNGETLESAVVLAGSVQRGKNARSEATKLLKRHPEWLEPIADIAEEKIRLTFKHMTAEKARQASFSALAVSAGILIDKLPSLQGRPTARIVVEHDLGGLSVEQLKAFVQAKLSGQKPLLQPGS